MFPVALVLSLGLGPAFSLAGDFDEAAQSRALLGNEDADAGIYFLTGGIWDWMNPPAVHRAFESAIGQVRQRNPESRLILAKFHQRKHKQLCRSITTTKQRNPHMKIVIVGHSYGGVEALGLSRCLQKQEIMVDLVITVDTVAKWIVRRNKARLVPENVRANFHYYTRGDFSFFFTSVGNNRPVSEEATLVRNFRISTRPIPFFAHMSTATKLLSSGVPQSLIQGVLDGKSPAELEMDHREVHNTLFAPADDLFGELDQTP